MTTKREPAEAGGTFETPSQVIDGFTMLPHIDHATGHPKVGDGRRFIPDWLAEERARWWA